VEAGRQETPFGSGRSTSVAALRALGDRVETGTAGITAAAPSRRHGWIACKGADRPAVTHRTTRWAPPRRCCVRGGAEARRCLENAATEPEGRRACPVLQRMGAHIEISRDGIVHRGRAPAARRVPVAGRRPARGFSYLVAGLEEKGMKRIGGNRSGKQEKGGEKREPTNGGKAGRGQSRETNTKRGDE